MLSKPDFPFLWNPQRLFELNFSRSAGKAWRIAVVCVCALLAAVHPAAAQVVGTGTIQGRVVDPRGAAISGAAVTATDPATGRRYARQTSPDGVYVISALPPGQYNVDFYAEGFSPVHQENIVVNAIDVVGLDMALKVGSETTRIIVTAAPPDLDTENGALDTTIPNSTYTALPVSMGGSPKSPLGFLSLIPGSASGDYGVQNINGGPGNSAFLYQNGLPVTTSEMQGDARNINGATTTEVVDQFQVLTSGIPAYYSGQGVTNLVLKSGTNQFHGDVYENVRNTAFDAAGYFATHPPVEHQNEYGFSVGGPFLKDRLFFFMNLDRYRYINQNQPTLYSLPTDAERGGDFSSLPVPIYDPASTTCTGGVCTRTAFEGNIIKPERISHISSALQAGLPPTINGNPQNNYSNGFVTGNMQNTYMGKLDGTINPVHHAYAMFQTGKVSPLGTPYNGGPQLPLPYASTRAAYQIISIAQAGETWTISPSLVNVFGMQFNQFKTPFINPTAGGNYPEKVGLAGLPQGDPSAEFPGVGFGGPNAPTMWANNGFSQSFSETANSYVYQDNLQWTHGRHSFTFGGQFIAQQENNTQPNTLGGFNFSNTETAGLDAQGATIATTGNSYASFLLGVVDSAGATETSVRETGARYKNYALYAQDDWKLTPKLTVNLGLRYIIAKPYVEVLNRESWFNPTLPNAAVGNYPGALQFAGNGADSCHCSTRVQTHYLVFDPRVGFAYAVTPATVVRGSFTIVHFNGGLLGGNAQSQGVSMLGFSANPSFTSPDAGITPAFNWNNGFPAYQAPPFFDSTLNTGYNTVTGPTGGTVAYDRPDIAGLQPYTENWNLTVSQAFTPTLTMQLSYAGSVSRHIAVNGGSGIYSDQIDPKYMALGTLLQQPATAGTLAAARNIVPGITLPYANFSGSIGQALRPFPQYSSVTDGYAQVGSASYNALQASLQKRMSSGLYFLAAYTWSKNMNVSGGTINFAYAASRSAYNIRAERSINNSDFPHQISLAWVYSLPYGKGRKFGGHNGALDTVAGGWQLSAVQHYTSGAPLGTITGACNVPYASGCYADYNPQYSGNHVRIHGSYGSGAPKGTTPTSYIDRNAFQDARSFTFGTTARTMAYGLRNPWSLNEDVTVGKDFNMAERYTLRLQADAFNVFNRTVFGGIGTNIDSANFGSVSSQANTARHLQFEAYFKF